MQNKNINIRQKRFGNCNATLFAPLIPRELIFTESSLKPIHCLIIVVLEFDRKGDWSSSSIRRIARIIKVNRESVRRAIKYIEDNYSLTLDKSKGYPSWNLRDFWNHMATLPIIPLHQEKADYFFAKAELAVKDRQIADLQNKIRDLDSAIRERDSSLNKIKAI